MEAEAPAPSDIANVNLSRRRVAFLASQWVALAVAAYLGWHGYRLVDDGRANTDRAAGYYLIALVLALYFAWDGGLPDLRSWPRRTVTYARTHPVELGVLATVCAAGIFVRLFRYGTLPPNGYIIFEEHIYGGIQWDVLQGARPYIYPLPTYLGALSMWLLGSSTHALRGQSIAAGIITLPLFYLMMREVAHRPGALFATAIWASLRVVNDIGPRQQTLFMGEVLLVWLTLRSLNSGRILWLVPAAVMAAILSYEYESAKAVPLFIVPFLGWVSLRALLWPLPRSLATVMHRVRKFGPSAIRAVAVVGVVVAILFGPMVAQSHVGRNIYFSSLDRQKADRDARGTPGLISPDWDKQAKWSAQAYTPWVDPDYNAIGSVPTRGVIDRVTSLLIWAAMASGIVFFWKGYRALFIGWFVGGMAMSSLLLSNWEPWKAASWLVPAVALTGFLADDAYNIVRTKRSGWAVGACVALAAVAAAAFGLNVRTLNANAHDQRVLTEFSNNPSYLYSICNNLRTRPDNNFAVVSQRNRSSWGFSTPPGDDQERRAAWGDFRFACWDLQGRTTADLQEVWPLYVDQDRPYSLVGAIPDAEAAAVIDVLQRVMPELGEPDTHADSPGKGFQLVIWDTSLDEINARRGLFLRRRSSAGEYVSEEISPGPGFDVSASPVADAFSLAGLVYLDSQSDVALVPQTGSPPLRITVDGGVSYDSTTGSPVVTRTSHLLGWHLVEVRGLAPTGGDIALRWQDAAGNGTALSADNYFALPAMGVWRHIRTFEFEGTRFQAIRFDFQPHVASMDGMRIDARTSLPLATKAVAERYTAIWQVPSARTYRLTLNAPSQRASLKIDGQERLPNPGVGTTWVIDVQLTAGDHAIELALEQPSENRYIGGLLTASDPASGAPLSIDVRPF